METATQRANANPKAVLIVDDNPIIRRLVIDRFLNDGFYSYAEASNGREAIDIAHECRPKLIIMDVSMPVMDGIEAAPLLKELLPETPIILFTQFAEYLKSFDLRPIVVSAVISKDITLDVLVAEAHQLLGE